MTFQDLHLLPALNRAVADMGYTQPSPIQAEAIPPVLAGRDLVGCAQTGTGKTAAFAIPILQTIQGKVDKTHKPIRALILTPTRELALQIKENFDLYGKYLPVRSAVIFGGVGQGPQVDALRRGIDVLVATPGRLNDLCNQGHIDLSRLEIFVLDEADRMLDMGFIHDVRKVIARIPQKRQTLLFSATMPQEIAELSQKILINPVRVEVTPASSTVDAIEQSLYKLDKGNKKYLLEKILEDDDLDSVLVFTNTKHGADRVVKDLEKAGIAAMAIHGNKGQNARVMALESFKGGKIRVLVATDIAARGIDVNELACVINYELPNIPETYVHRIGRTGRAGRSGIAVSFCNYDELAYLKDIEKLTGKRVPVVGEHAWPMEIFEATPKAVRQPRPPRMERQQTKAAPKKVKSTPAAQEGSQRQSAKAAAPKAAAPRAAAPRAAAPRAATSRAAAPRAAAQSSSHLRMAGDTPRAVPRPKFGLEGTRPAPVAAPGCEPYVPSAASAQVRRKPRSTAPSLPGYVVAVADGRNRRRGK